MRARRRAGHAEVWLYLVDLFVYFVAMRVFYGVADNFGPRFGVLRREAGFNFA